MDVSVDIIIKRIIENIDYYSGKLENVDIDITEMEWKNFFETIYIYLRKKSMENEYYDILSIIIRDAFNKSQYLSATLANSFSRQRKKYIITLYNLLNSLDILKLFNFNLLEIEQIIKDISEKCLWGEVVNIKDYQKIKSYMYKD